MVLCGHKECLYNKDGQWCTKKIVVMGNNAVCKQVWEEVWNDGNIVPVYRQPRSQEELAKIAEIPKRKINIVEAEIILQEDAAQEDVKKQECQKCSAGQQESIQP